MSLYNYEHSEQFRPVTALILQIIIWDELNFLQDLKSKSIHLAIKKANY